jgi:5,6-dimethylbenzimidazole synthase
MHAFSHSFRSDLTDLMRWRRDVRRFRTAPVDEALLMRCLDAFLLAPSVGLSEPWRIIRVEGDAARKAALANFRAANDQALQGYSGEKAKLYAGLKLSGMKESPIQLAIFCDDGTDKGAGLGAGTMPEMRRYSVVTAITLFWLAARAEGLGVGWVSILDPDRLCLDLDVPADWSLVGYLCVGWPEDDTETPELETLGWEARRASLPMTKR